VLRYSREELLALHFATTSPPKFPEDTPVASEHSLPPVGTLPFDYDEIYKQWSLNRNRGRGRGRGNATGTGSNQQSRGVHDRSRSEGKWGDDAEWDKHGKVRQKRVCYAAVVLRMVTDVSFSRVAWCRGMMDSIMTATTDGSEAPSRARARAARIFGMTSVH
jgi:hypothetical protein